MKRALKVCLLSFGGLMLTVYQASALSLDAVLLSLDQHYPPLLAARQKLSMAEGKLLQKRGAFDTKFKAKTSLVPLGYYEQVVLDGLVEQATPLAGLTFYGGYRLGAGEFAVYDGKKVTDGLGEIRSGFILPLLRDNAIDLPRLEIAQAELDLERARLGVLEKQLKFIKEASKRYWAWVSAARKQVLANDLLLLAQKRNQDLNQSVVLGQSPRIVLTENQTALLKRQAKLVETQQKQQQTAWELSLFLLRNAEGRPQLPQTPAPEGFPPLPSVDISRLNRQLVKAFSFRPEPQDLALQLAQNQLHRQWAENQNLPQLDLNFGISKDLGGSDKTREPLELEAGLGFEWPLQLRKAQGLLQTLEAEKKQLEWELRFSREEIEIELQNLVTVLQAAQQRVALVRAQVKVALELETAERERFALGATTLLVLNLREQARADAMNEEIEALEIWFKSWAEYLAALGLLQESALALP